MVLILSFTNIAILNTRKESCASYNDYLNTSKNLLNKYHVFFLSKYYNNNNIKSGRVHLHTCTHTTYLVTMGRNLSNSLVPKLWIIKHPKWIFCFLFQLLVVSFVF